MDRDLLSHLPVVLTVARRGGFGAAASELGMSPSSVSHAVKLVEERLGAPLFARTTRSVALTELGERFVSLASAGLAELNTAWELAQSELSGASGLLRINAPRITLDWVLKPILAAMAEDYPGVTIEVFFEDGLADVVGEGFDAGIRLGRMVSDAMIGVRIAPAFRVILVASPTYCARRGEPKSVSDLTAHQCLQYRMTSAGNIYRWDLSEGGADVQVDTKGGVIVNDMLQALSLAEAGFGICYTFEPLARRAIERGALVEVLPEAAIEEDGLTLYYPRRASQAPKLRAFVDTARRYLTSR